MAEEILAADNAWGRENLASLGIQPLVGCMLQWMALQLRAQEHQ